MKKLAILSICLCVCCTYLGAQSSNLYKELLYGGQHKELIQRIHNEVPEPRITGDTARTLAQAYEGLLKYREAYRYYQRWRSVDTLCIDALNAMARMALQLGRVKEGEDLYLKAFAIDSTNFNAGLQLAKLYYQLKNFEKAYDHYYALLMQDTTNVSLLSSVGDCLVELGEEMTAILFYDEAVSLNKENASLAITLINTLLSVRRYAPDVFIKRSMEVCDTALAYNAGYRNLLQSKGVIYYLAKEYWACDSVMSNLIAAGDSTLLNFRYVALSRYNQNRFFDAIPCLEYWYGNDTTNVEVAMMLGVSLGRTYDRKRALLLFDHVEKLIQPSEEIVYNIAYQRGTVYQADFNHAQAAKYFWQAARMETKNRRAALGALVNLYPYTNAERLRQATPEQYARGLFAQVIYLRDVRDNPYVKKNERNMAHCRFILNLYLEDMFFKDVTRLEMWDPEGKKEWITEEELRKLVKDE